MPDEKIASEEEILEAAYSRAFNVKGGEKIKEDLYYYLHKKSNSLDPMQLAYQEGERALALRLLTLCGELE